MAKKKLPLYELKKGSDDFIDAIALVDNPAIQSDFFMFSDEREKYFFADDVKQMIFGAVMIPEMEIYRVKRDEFGNALEFNVKYSAETVEAYRNEFMKNKRLDAFNFMHISNAKPEDVYVVETFMIVSAEQQKDIKQRFKAQLPIGTWTMQIYVENLELYNEIKELGFRGFSVQGTFESIPVDMIKADLAKLNNDNNNNNKLMSKLINKFKAVLAEFEAEELATDRIAETGQQVKVGKEGEPVVQISVSPSGEATESPLPDGTYVLENGDSIEVKAGMLVTRTVKPEDKPVEPPTSGDTKQPEVPPVSGDTAMADYPWDTCIQEQLDAGYDEETAEKICGKIKEENMNAADAIASLQASGFVCKKKEEMAEVPPVSGSTAPVVDVTSKTLGEVIDVTKDGEYTIKCIVAGGVITEATVQANQDLVNAQQQMAAQTNKIGELEAEIVKLQEQLKKPVTQPIVNQKKKVEMQANLTPYERSAMARGFKVIK